MSVKETIETLTDKMNANPEPISGLSYVYQFNLSGDDSGVYQLKIENGEAAYTEGESWEARLTLEMSDKNFKKLAQDDLNPTMAYMGGKLKVQGDLSHALKFHGLIQQYQ